MDRCRVHGLKLAEKTCICFYSCGLPGAWAPGEGVSPSPYPFAVQSSPQPGGVGAHRERPGLQPPRSLSSDPLPRAVGFQNGIPVLVRVGLRGYGPMSGSCSSSILSDCPPTLSSDCLALPEICAAPLPGVKPHKRWGRNSVAAATDPSVPAWLPGFTDGVCTPRFLSQVHTR